jgi:hypothetical protein
MLPPELTSVILVALAVHIDAVEFDGVTNGAGARIVPLDAVRFGVANAGDATMTNAATSTSADSTMPLMLFTLCSFRASPNSAELRTDCYEWHEVAYATTQ